MLTPRTRPFLIAALAAIVGFALAAMISWQMAAIVATNAFFAIYLLQAFGRIARLNQEHLKLNAANDDAPGVIIFVVTVLAVAGAMVSLFLVINEQRVAGPIELGLALVAVPLGWATIHLMCAFHYAHLFWQPGPGQGSPRKGLEFPGTDEPEGWDFVYFAFVIGMAAQTSDVAISGRHIRHFNIAHAVVAFFFNTVLVAAAVNLAVTLGG